MAQWTERERRKRRDRNGHALIHPLKDLLWCETHQRYLKSYGANGTRFACPACKADNTESNGSGQVGPLFSSVNQELALSTLIQALVPRIVADKGLVALIIESSQKQIEATNAPDPAKISALQKELTGTTENIEFIMDHPGDTATDRRESGQRLERLTQRTSLQRKSQPTRMTPSPRTPDRRILC